MKKFLLFLGVFLVGSLTSLGIAYAILPSYTSFPDVNYNDYYGDSLVEMQERNVISGYSNGKFGPNDAVSRAQLVTILDRYDQSLFNANYDSSSMGIVYLLCDSLNEEDVKDAYKGFYNDLCKQEVLL
ncbi:MAG: S-layer homology domain-containing protein [Candidatus Gracilibacteria bacterium]|jgi:hypothetical protein|nr:S-layer homology domain-containing protein [Candidatus Gracilibacteria bacterium]